VIHRAHKSSEVELECSVPGPLLFILYTAELADIAVKWNVNVHSYDDDTQSPVAL